MLEINTRLTADFSGKIDDTLVLDHEARKRGRLRVTSAAGQEVGIFLPRGRDLGVGEVLRSKCGKHLRVAGALESVVTATATDWAAFSRVCYHLGNRHVPLQIGERWVRFKPDHVLEELVTNFGLRLRHENAIFEPEAGAYAKAHAHHH